MHRRTAGSHYRGSGRSQPRPLSERNAPAGEVCGGVESVAQPMTTRHGSLSEGSGVGTTEHGEGGEAREAPAGGCCPA